MTDSNAPDKNEPKKKKKRATAASVREDLAKIQGEPLPTSLAPPRG